MRLSLFIALVLSAAGCAPPGGLCEQRAELAGERCVTSEDCPRPVAEVGVCHQDTGNERTCVLCAPPTVGAAASQCFLITAVTCS
ncbi:MAG: hypothetical protein M3Y59_14480 [Myxococcota bacterium]|nr:hypothetical protein [Myxococcota bacterium]